MQKTKLLIGMQRSILVHLNVTSPSLLRRRQTLFRLICLPVFATSNDSRHIIPAGCRFKFWVSDFTALWFGSEEDQSVMRGKAEHMDVRSKAPRKKKKKQYGQLIKFIYFERNTTFNCSLLSVKLKHCSHTVL